MRTLGRDLRYAIRTLLKSPGFAASAIGVLALGIGANAAIFSVVNAVLLRPMPFPDPDRLVKIYHVPPAQSMPGMKLFGVSPANYLDWRAQGSSFDGMAAYQARTFAMTGLDRPEVVTGAIVGADFFPILRVNAEMGRVFHESDDRPGQAHVAVISHRLWETHFGSSPTALGGTLILNEQPYTIIGVAPASIHFVAWDATSGDVWIPLGWDEQTRAARNNHFLRVLARLKRGVTITKAQAEMDAISHRLADAYPTDDRDWGATVMSLRGELVDDIRMPLLVLLGAVAFVLLIACANVANLITARNLGRAKEFALRAALGASRGRMLQQLLSESLILSVAGGVAGIVLASAVMPTLTKYVSERFPIAEIPLDRLVLMFTFAISLVTGLIAGVIPAWRGSNADVNDALKQGSRSATERGGRFTRGVLAAVEVALSLMLLAGAGLMIRSLWVLLGVDPGFDPTNVLTMEVSSSTKGLKDAIETLPRFERVLDRVRAVPGVESAGLIDSLPMVGGSFEPFTIEGRPAALYSQQPSVQVAIVSLDYFRTMRIPVLRGRDFNKFDVIGQPRVVLISESMARQFWPGENPIGKHLTLSFQPDKSCEIVGIVGDVKQEALDATGPAPTLYRAEEQLSFDAAHMNGVSLSLAVRTAGRPENSIGAIKSAIEKLDPTQPVRKIRTMQEIVDESTSERRMSRLLLSTFAGLALVLAAFGLYSVLAYSIRRRNREIGIRMALGADARDVLRIVAMESLRPVGAGMLVGLVGSLALSRLIATLIYGIKPTDPLTFVAVAVVLGVVAMAASIVPALRATGVDPLQVLREE